MTIQEFINRSKDAQMPRTEFQNKKYLKGNWEYPIKDTMNGILKLRYYTGPARGWMWIDCLMKHCKECSEPIIVFGKSYRSMTNTTCSRNCKLAYAHARLEPIKYEGKIYTLDDCNATEKKRANPISTHVNSIKSHKRRMQNPEYAKKYRAKCAKNARIKRKLNPPTEEERLLINKRNNENYHRNPQKYLQKGKERRLNFTPEQKEHARKVKREWERQDRIKNYPKYLIQGMINHVIRCSNAGKVKPISKYGFDVNKISIYLSKQAKDLGYSSCLDIKRNGYDVDHIIPKKSYDLNDEKEMLKCNSVHNLRWLTSFENRSKGCKLRSQDIKVIETLPKSIYPKQWGGVIPN